MSTAHVDRPRQTNLARDIEALSIAEWGPRRATTIIGRHPLLEEAMGRVERFASAEAPVLITGETGTGKDLFARALYLQSRFNRKLFLSVNCAQYSDGNLLASELFGHRKGSFTGAVADKRGVFEEADGGSIFLDEVGELSLTAQAMLLRVLGEGEIVPVGGSRPKVVDVRVVAATSRDLPRMVADGTFRADLYYRLRNLQVPVPALRDRGDDWVLIARHYLERLCIRNATDKRLSDEAEEALNGYRWPGNVREVRGVVDTGFHLSTDDLITPRDFGSALETAAQLAQLSGLHLTRGAELCASMARGESRFWDVVHRPFMERDLNRGEVQEVVSCGLRLAGGSYKRLLGTFGIPDGDYLKFMDFLRHHRLKPAHDSDFIAA
jgi:transcriptional regulator with GAF, ATPase, and Fis domain